VPIGRVHRDRAHLQEHLVVRRHEGKQFMVVAVGGVGEPPEWVAMGLP
jgi:hypothetical protein